MIIIINEMKQYGQVIYLKFNKYIISFDQLNFSKVYDSLIIFFLIIPIHSDIYPLELWYYDLISRTWFDSPGMGIFWPILRHFPFYNFWLQTIDGINSTYL